MPEGAQGWQFGDGKHWVLPHWSKVLFFYYFLIYLARGTALCLLWLPISYRFNIGDL